MTLGLGCGGGGGGGCQSSGCGVVQLVEKTSAEKCGWLDITSPSVAHAHRIGSTGGAQTWPNGDLFTGMCVAVV